MNSPDAEQQPTRGGALVWVGRIISALVVATFGMSGVMKLMGGPDLAKEMEPLGLPETMVFPLGILELTCAVIYLISTTSVIGAILLTGYIGGAICTHWRVGDPFIFQVVVGICIWLGVYLREARLRALIPYRKRE